MASLLLASYPLGLVSLVWWHVFKSDLPGGRNGPLDAYRHTLASAYASYSLSPKAVQVVTYVMESSDKAASRMDAHNNLIGASIGDLATDFKSIEQIVVEQVRWGTFMPAEEDQTEWLPVNEWGDSRLW